MKIILLIMSLLFFGFFVSACSSNSNPTSSNKSSY